MIALAQLVALAASIVALLTIVVLPLLWRAALRALDRVPPAAQAVALEALVAAPWALPVVAVALALAPSVAGLAVPAIDHCAAHHDHHAHLCLAHPPAHAEPLGWVVIASALAWLAVRAGPALARELRSHAEVRRLRSSARREPGGLLVLPTPRVICAVAGVVDPVVLLSEGARARIDGATLRIALAHEAAHVARGDVARQSIARVLASVHLERDALLGRLAVARERACDEHAAATNDRLDVASALVRAARCMDVTLPHTMATFGPDVLEMRVRALLREPIAAPDRRTVVAIASASMLVAAAVTPFVHHALETLLGAITH